MKESRIEKDSLNRKTLADRIDVYRFQRMLDVETPEMEFLAEEQKQLPCMQEKYLSNSIVEVAEFEESEVVIDLEQPQSVV